MYSIKRGHIVAIVLAALITLPGIAIRVTGAFEPLLHSQPILVATFAGMAVLGASFLLLWACDALQEDLSQTLVLAIVALIAVLPEYAVDMYCTWMAGQYPQSDWPHLAIANMTGANRLLIGVAWSVIAFLFWVKTRRDVVLQTERRTELFFLGIATLYAFSIPIKGSLAWYDGLIFIGIYVWYLIIARRRPVAESEAEGPAECILALPKTPRRALTYGMILFAGAAILANAEPFSHGLVQTGKLLGVSEFLLMQWLAPIASEAPEFTVAIMFALRGHAGLALGSLLSSKLNQWTLLVGMIPGVYALSAGHIMPPMPMDGHQMQEILLTAAQSLLGVMLLVTLRLSVWQGVLLFVLFIGQFIAPPLVHALAPLPPTEFVRILNLEAWRGYLEGMIHPLFSIIYIATAIGIFLDHPKRLWEIWHGARLDTPIEAMGADEALEMATKP
ncbi:MAG: Sodium/calcium exchanger protein [bacterium ADurb.Bin429]|nr:MAG: Sodium/calcium exchanger protein [bacterium ADurb.Bin429]